MPAFGIIGLVAAFVSVLALAEAANKFFGRDDDGHEPRPSTNSSSRSSGPTGPPHQSSPSYTRGSYARDQTADRPHVTSDYGRSFYDSKHTSPHARAPARAKASYQRSLSLDPPHIPKSYQSSPTHPRSPYFSPAYQQTATDVNRSCFTHVVQPSPVPEDLSESDPGSDEMEDGDNAEKLRARARHRYSEMCDARARAKSARRVGDYVAVRRYEEDATMHKNATEELNAEAAKKIFHQKNKGHRQGTVDLHGLHVQEAIQYAEQELQSARWRGDEVVRFIVGKGLHAQDGRAKIRPALEELCDERSLIHSLDPRNAGVLIVHLDTDPF